MRKKRPTSLRTHDRNEQLWLIDAQLLIEENIATSRDLMVRAHDALIKFQQDRARLRDISAHLNRVAA